MIRNEDFYTKYGIDVKLRSFVEKIDSDNQSLLLRGWESIKYDKLLLATVLLNIRNIIREDPLFFLMWRVISWAMCLLLEISMM